MSKHETYKKFRKKHADYKALLLIFAALSFIFILNYIFAINFGDASPDTGEADSGSNDGTFGSETGTFTDTQTNNNIFFGVERTNNAAANANQTLGFDVTVLSGNSSIKITGLNGTLSYCNARRSTNNCDGTGSVQAAQGTNSTHMSVYILNATSGNYMAMGLINATASNTETLNHWNLSPSANFSQFINATGYVTVRFEFAWSGTGRASFLNDHTNLTITYDRAPTVTLSSPANNTNFNGRSNITFVCNSTDDNGLVNATLFTNITGSFIANQTKAATTTFNSTTFNITNVPIGIGYRWNCLVSDGVTASIFAPGNFTFSVSDNTAPTVNVVAPTPGNNTNQTGNSVYVNATADDADTPIGTCRLEWSGVNESMTKVGTGLNVSCFTNKTGISDGTYTYKVNGNDSYNNVGVSETRTVTIDSTGPAIAYVAPTDANGATVGRDNTFINVTVTDALSFVDVCTLEWGGVNESMTKVGTGTSVSCYKNKTSLANGNYSYKVNANDTLNNFGVSALRTINISVTVQAPTITFVAPTDEDGSFVSRNNTFINVTVSNTNAIDTCLLNFNGTITTMTKVGTGTSVSCFTNKTGLGDGLYNYNITANDTTNFIGFSGTRSITIDTLAPSVAYVDPTPADGTSQSSSSVFFNVTAIDATSSISACTLEINGVNETMTKFGTGLSISCSKNKTLSDGAYNYRIYGNDSANNIGFTGSRTVNVDTTPPSITFVDPTPGNATNQSATSVFVNVTVIDATTSIGTCTLEWAGVNETMTKVGTGLSVSCNKNKTGLTSGTYNYRVYANDSANNINVSGRKVTIDTDNVNFISLGTNPNTTALLDPGVVINITANVTDNTTNVNAVIFQYKVNTTDVFTNVTMGLNSSSGIWNASFNASTEGDYNLRLYANDSASNAAVSNQINISVLLDRTWTRSPASFTAVSATTNQNISAGIAVLNNTGDAALNFSMVSDYTNTSFNETFPLTIAAGAIKNINVSVIAPATSGTTLVTLTMNASPNASPANLTTNFNIVVSQDAFLSATIVTYPSSVTQGDTGVSLSARLDNAGQRNATNVTFFYILPTDWVVTSGARNITVGDLDAGEFVFNNIEVTIRSNASTGTQTVTANSTGFNQSGFNLSALGNILGHSVSITVNAPTPALGVTGEVSAPTPAPSAGTGSGGSTGGAVTKIETGETIYTTAVITLVRGETDKVPIQITNLYENAVFEDTNLEVQGFMSQYVTLTPKIDYNKLVNVETKSFLINKLSGKQLVTLEGMPDHSIEVKGLGENFVNAIFSSDPANLTLFIGDTEKLDTNNDGKEDVTVFLKNITKQGADLKINRLGPPEPNKIYFMESREYELGLFVPPYLQKQDYNLTIKISADLKAVNPELAGFISKSFVEYRTLLFKVFEVGIEEVNQSLEQSRKDIKDMEQAGFPVKRAKELLAQAERAFYLVNYESVKTITKQISALRKDAFDADTLIKEVQKGINDAKSRLLKTSESETALELALKAFEREDFETALSRAKEAQLTLILETKGKVNIIWFLSKYWWAVILSIFILSMAVYISYRKLAVSIINERLKNLSKEEISLNSLIKELQTKYLKEGAISADEYYTTLDQYESRLNKIKHISAKLRNKRIGIIKTDRELSNLEREEREIKDLMKKAQIDYLERKIISRKKFNDIYDADRSKLAEIEEEKELIKEKLAKERYKGIKEEAIKKRKEVYKTLKESGIDVDEEE